MPVVTLDARATHNAGHTRSMVRFKKIKSRAGTRTVSVADAKRAEATRNAADDDDPFGNYPTPSTRDANEDKAVKQAVKPKNKKSGVLGERKRAFVELGDDDDLKPTIELQSKAQDVKRDDGHDPEEGECASFAATRAAAQEAPAASPRKGTGARWCLLLIFTVILCVFLPATAYWGLANSWSKTGEMLAHILFGSNLSLIHI